MKECGFFLSDPFISSPFHLPHPPLSLFPPLFLSLFTVCLHKKRVLQVYKRNALILMQGECAFSKTTELDNQIILFVFYLCL